MALPRGEFTTLIRDLRAAGPVDRVRLLARSLKALRGLSPWDRKVLLRMAGFEGAETLVERLAQEDEATAARLRGLLGELEERPDELERTVRGLADPAQRSAAVDEILATLDRGMDGAEEEPAPAPLPEAPPVPETPPVPERPVPLTPPAPPPEPPGPPSPPAAAAEPRPEPPPEPEPKVEDEAGVEGEPDMAPAPEPPPEPVPEPVPEPAPPSPAPRVPELSAPPPDGARVSAPGVLERLLDLRRRTDGGEAPSAADLGRSLETEIPFPWARRRAVQAWIEGRGGEDLDGALSLIAGLSAPTDRTWCLADLAERKEWSDGEWRRIVEAAPTPAARRRLERRRAAIES